MAGEAGSLSDIALRSKAFWGYGRDFMSACRPELRISEDDIAHDDVWVVQTPEGGLGGFAHCVCADGVFEVLALFIAPEHIGKGYGTDLWQIVERRARALGCAGIGLDSDPYAVGFYRRMGMVEHGEAPSGSVPGRWLPRMVKRLS
ncbi:putative acetyltransferase [Lutibaculum baratangense AMV1]|uniref:Putative acetyltransferase n=1 Tax=Lutibaculum baratangense AMV1 TaxID=631454 RepID=V4RLR2_9HYPH|nr:putative acetyltransferase [Lutibaculum baratangense AMV1]